MEALGSVFSRSLLQESSPLPRLLPLNQNDAPTLSSHSGCFVVLFYPSSFLWVLCLASVRSPLVCKQFENRATGSFFFVIVNAHEELTMCQPSVFPPASSHFIPITALSRGYFCSYIMEERTESWEVEVTCLRTRTSKRWSRNLNPGLHFSLWPGL